MYFILSSCDWTYVGKSWTDWTMILMISVNKANMKLASSVFDFDVSFAYSWEYFKSKNTKLAKFLWSSLIDIGRLRMFYCLLTTSSESVSLLK